MVTFTWDRERGKVRWSCECGAGCRWRALNRAPSTRADMQSHEKLHQREFAKLQREGALF